MNNFVNEYLIFWNNLGVKTMILLDVTTFFILIFFLSFISKKIYSLNYRKESKNLDTIINKNHYRKCDYKTVNENIIDAYKLYDVLKNNYENHKDFIVLKKDFILFDKVMSEIFNNSVNFSNNDKIIFLVNSFRNQCNQTLISINESEINK